MHAGAICEAGSVGDRNELPTGTVTLLFTDIEGSTALLELLGDAYGDVLALHHATLRKIWTSHRGVEVKTDGDAFFVAFDAATDAVAAAQAGREALSTAAWPEGVELRVRMGIHTGEPRVRDDDYWGSDVHYAARVASAANGGQVLLSNTTASIVPDVGSNPTPAIERSPLLERASCTSLEPPSASGR